MEPRRVRRERTKGWQMPANTVYVGRGSQWGNPYRLDRLSATEWIALDLDGNEVEASWGEPGHTAQWVVDRFREEVAPGLDLTPLRGKSLACWCHLAMPCHADVLLDLANRGPGAESGN